MNNCKICEVECPSTFCGDCSKMIGQGIAALTADRDRWRDRCERLIAVYNDHDNWLCYTCEERGKCDDQSHQANIWEMRGDKHGFDFAQQIQREIELQSIRRRTCPECGCGITALGV